DGDRIANAEDCEELNRLSWRNQAYSDTDEDGVRDSTTLTTTTCFGDTVPEKFTLAENGPDNCPNDANADQKNTDQELADAEATLTVDALGDVCDDDKDGDGVLNADDKDVSGTDASLNPTLCQDVDADGCDDCSVTRNPPNPANDGTDIDSDGLCYMGLEINQLSFSKGLYGDDCPEDNLNDQDEDSICKGIENRYSQKFGRDNCPAVANPDQLDTDRDAGGADFTMGTSDDFLGADGLLGTADDVGGDACDACPYDSAGGFVGGPNGDDFDGDTICTFIDAERNPLDNCPAVANKEQEDTDGDLQGDVCDVCPETEIAAEVDDKGCSQIQVDTDADGICDPGKTSTFCTGNDNCINVKNGNSNSVDTCLEVDAAFCNQADNDGDAAGIDGILGNTDDKGGDACDTDDDNDGVTDADDCDPLNSAAWQMKNIYEDNDRDGYTAGNPDTMGVEERCIGNGDDIVFPETLTPSDLEDCDDRLLGADGSSGTIDGDTADDGENINPGAIEICDGVDNDCDFDSLTNTGIDESGNALCTDAFSCTENICLGSAGCEFVETDLLCDDGKFCSGVEICDVDNINAGTDGCVAGTPIVVADEDITCTVDSCIERVDGSEIVHTVSCAANFICPLNYLKECQLLGNIDNLGSIDLQDVVRLLDHLSGKNSLINEVTETDTIEAKLYRADVNCDRVVNILDAIKLIRFINVDLLEPAAELTCS
ncbi:hypothetical protein HYX13_02615, partial [Candidatus Woesearchaeota archaeon]|nr:hypothetical protein [Candidatus Woesearchaeota archaeon]